MIAPLHVFVVNLDKDVDRLRATEAQFADLRDFTLRRQRGVLTADLPDVAVRALSRNAHLHRGALGCFLAHAAAWERIAAADEAGLIVEDDISIKGLDRLFRVELPDGADILFCNSRMDPGVRPAGTAEPCVCEAKSILSRKREKFSPPGGDAYLLTASGARKLLASVAKVGFHGHVDWRLLRACLHPHEIAGVVAGTWMEKWPALLRPERFGEWGLLAGYCLSPGLVEPRRAVVSSRSAIDLPAI